MTYHKKGQSLGFVSLLLMIFIVALVGTALMPSVAQNTAVATATTGINDTPSETLLNLNTLMYALLIMGSVAGLSFLVLRYSGLI